MIKIIYIELKDQYMLPAIHGWLICGQYDANLTLNCYGLF